MKNRSRATVILIVVILAAAAIGAYFLKRESVAEKLAAIKPPGPAHVEFAPISKQQWGTLVESVGTIQSFSGITLRAQIAGRITAVHAKSGAEVKVGDPLFEINPSVIQAQLEAQQAQMKNTQFNYERMKELYAERTVSLQQFTAAKSAYNVDLAGVRTSKQQLALATTNASFDGVVGVTQVQVGDEVGINQELATLQSSERLRVEFSVPQKYAQVVSNKDAVQLSAEHDSAAAVGATIYAINPLIDTGTRSVEVRAEVPPHSFLPGSYVNVSLTLNDTSDVLTVPQTALLHSLYGDSVYKVVAGKAVQTHVVPGSRRGADIAVSGDIKAGDKVVSAGLRKITDGSEVVDTGAKAKAGSDNAN
jgi:membrane fusion protein (multidrug efflux system)